MEDRRTSSFCSNKADKASESQFLSPLPQRALPLDLLSFWTENLERAYLVLCKCFVKCPWIAVVGPALRDCVVRPLCVQIMKQTPERARDLWGLHSK